MTRIVPVLYVSFCVFWLIAFAVFLITMFLGSEMSDVWLLTQNILAVMVCVIGAIYETCKKPTNNPDNPGDNDVQPKKQEEPYTPYSEY